MKKETKVALVFLAVSIVLMIISIVVLPEYSIVQMSAGKPVGYMPKAAAVAMPVIITAFGAWLYSGTKSVKNIIVMCLGIFCSCFVLYFNWIIV